MASELGFGDWVITLYRIYKGYIGAFEQADPDQIIDTESLLDRCDMLIDAPRADTQTSGDCFKLVPSRHKIEYLTLALSEYGQIQMGFFNGCQAQALSGGTTPLPH